MDHRLDEGVHLHPRLRFHPPPLLPHPGDIPVGGESTTERAVDLLPSEVFHGGGRCVDLLVLDRVNVRLDQGEQSVLLLGDPVLRPLPLLQQDGGRARGHPGPLPESRSSIPS